MTGLSGRYRFYVAADRPPQVEVAGVRVNGVEAPASEPVELTGGTPFPRIGQLPYLLTLPGHGFYWLDIETDAHPVGAGAMLAEGLLGLASLAFGAINAACRPASITVAAASSATTVLPEPTSPCSSRSIRLGLARSVSMAVLVGASISEALWQLWLTPATGNIGSHRTAKTNNLRTPGGL